MTVHVIGVASQLVHRTLSGMLMTVRRIACGFCLDRCSHRRVRGKRGGSVTHCARQPCGSAGVTNCILHFPVHSSLYQMLEEDGPLPDNLWRELSAEVTQA